MFHTLLSKLFSRKFLFINVGVFALLACVLAGLIVFGGPGVPDAMPSINKPFNSVDFSSLPALGTYTARDGAKLAFRQYPTSVDKKGSIVLVHGSSASSESMHVMAQAFAADGYATYALDMRGHGASGDKGQIAYIGQLEDDVEDFLAGVSVAQPRTLLGFSSGAGFVLRVAGSVRQAEFNHYLLISPFLSHTAPTYRPNSGGWVKVGIPRIVGLSILNSAGITAFNHLTVTQFALNERAKQQLTPSYSFAMLANFRPQDDYRQNIRDIKQTTAVLIGSADELFQADQFPPVFAAENPKIPVKLVPNVGHIGMTLDAQAVAESVAAVNGLNLKPIQTN